MRRLNSVEKRIQEIATPKRKVFPAFMGSGADFAQISTGTLNKIWVTYEGSGIIQKVWNLRLPATPGMRVLVGIDEVYSPGVLQVLSERVQPGMTPTLPLGNHAPTHELYGTDELRVFGGQIMPLNAIPIPGTFTILLWDAVVLTGAVWTNFIKQNVTLTPVTTGARWATIQVDQSGVANVKLSAVVTSKSLLLYSDIPLADSPQFPAWAVMLYNGQAELQKNDIFNDFVDLRWGNAYLGGGVGTTIGDMIKSVYDTNNNGIVDDTDAIGGAAVNNPLSPATGQTIQWDGAKFIAADSASGGMEFSVDGRLAVVSNADNAYVFTAGTDIPVWYAYLKTTGSAGSSIFDIHLFNNTYPAGVTIFTTQANRPTVAYNDANGWVMATPNITSFVAGDVLTFDIDQVATGAADVVCVGGTVGGTPYSLTVGAVTNVNNIQFIGATVTDDTGGQVTVTNDIGEGHISIFPPSYSATSGTWGFSAQSSTYLGWYFVNSSKADGNYIEYKVYLAVGTYTFLLVSPKNTDGGKVDVYFDASKLGTINLYNASLVWNQRSTITSISVTTPGIKTLKLLLNGKDGSQYYCYFNYIALWRTT